ncbi:hypothetical protein MT390_17260 [Vibrio sp. 2-Bac 85]
MSINKHDELQLLVPHGTKAWQFKYRHSITSKYVKLNLGVYPTLSLVNDRNLTNKYKSLFALRLDLKTYIQEQKIKIQRKEASTLYSVTELWHDRKN